MANDLTRTLVNVMTNLRCRGVPDAKERKRAGPYRDAIESRSNEGLESEDYKLPTGGAFANSTRRVENTIQKT